MLKHAIARRLDEQGMELHVGPGAGDPVTLPERVPHDLDHVTEALLNVLTTMACGETGSERLDRPPELPQLTALILALRTEGAPFDDVRVQQIPVADGADPGTHIGPGADQAFGLKNAQRFTYDGAGDLETLTDLFRYEGAIGAQIAGDDHLSQLLNELAVEATATAGRASSARPAELGIGTVPGAKSGTLASRRLRIRVAVEFTRAGEAGIGGAGGGHHGVRKGTHASFVGAAQPPLEVFGEKHTKG
ncbi:hypothetical protein GCM10010207_54910 [Streptomyces atratus]|nr:hypothetical protein GCM10010207_54910 [Streptomyces atratus]